MRELIESFISSNYDSQTSAQIVDRICNGRGGLLDVVESLEPLLTSENSGQRAAGTRLLADVLHGLPRDLLSGEHTSFICAFFLERMKDHHNVVPAVLHVLPCLLSSAEGFESGHHNNVLLTPYFLTKKVVCKNRLA
ncbi:hypothetical protein FHG87_018060 [Trinorchestia longiramus]|nr:hypothetical protein FHG87_018060 [Trinorchestia longiramus]